MIRAEPRPRPGPGRGAASEAGTDSPQSHRRDSGVPAPVPDTIPDGPYAVYRYTPPAGPAGPGGPDTDRDVEIDRRSKCPRLRLRCPPCSCTWARNRLSPLARALQAWADGVGAWPAGRRVSAALCPILLLLQLWALLYCFLGERAMPGPGGGLFRLGAMFVCAQLAGWLVQRVSGMPALVGMLVVGVAMRSAGYLGAAVSSEYVDLIANLRKTALVLIMLRAGLGLDPAMLRALSLVVLGLAVLPATVEVCALMVVAYLLLGLPWLWGLLLGLVLAAVAPSVVMPCFISLRERRLGTDRGIDTLVVASASFDDVIAISLFGVVLGLIFTGGTSPQELVQHPLGLLFGILYGAALGKILQFLPTKDAKYVSMWRFALLFAGGMVVSFGSDVLDYHEAGPVGCIAAALTAAAGWRAKETVASVDAVEKRFSVVWAVFEPIMFSLIGAAIDTAILDGGRVGLCVACILIALVFRMLSTWLLLLVANFNWKERLFVSLAWLPKADVQAALGPLALDAARQTLGVGVPVQDHDQREDEDEHRAITVLLVAVLSILITAPAGAAIIHSLAPALLTPSSPHADAEAEGEGSGSGARVRASSPSPSSPETRTRESARAVRDARV